MVFSYRHYIVGSYSRGRNKTKISFNTAGFLYFQNGAVFIISWASSRKRHLSPTPLVATLYEDHSRKQPAPVTRPEGVRLLELRL